MARNPEAQAVHDDEAVTPAPGAVPPPEAPKTGIAALLARVTATRPVRVFQHYTADGGGLMAAGMSYNAVFAVFAALWLVFSVAGFVIAGDKGLQGTLEDGINSAVPGLIGENGIDLDELLSAGTLSWTGAIALVGLLLTALGFLASMRDAVRRIFELPGDTTFFLLQKAKDLGLALGFGVLILISAALSVVSSATLQFIFDILSLDGSIVAAVVIKAIGYVLVFAVDFVTVAAAFRILSAIRIPRKRLFAGAAIGAAGIGVLKAAFALGLIGGAGNNPLLAGFAVIIGLLIFFNFFCQVLLLSASWIEVGMADAGIDVRSLSPAELAVEEAKRLEDARRLVADANHKRAEEEYRRATGLAKWRLGRRLKREVRDEARRRKSVPTTTEIEAEVAEQPVA